MCVSAYPPTTGFVHTARVGWVCQLPSRSKICTYCESRLGVCQLPLPRQALYVLQESAGCVSFPSRGRLCTYCKSRLGVSASLLQQDLYVLRESAGCVSFPSRSTLCTYSESRLGVSDLINRTNSITYDTEHQILLHFNIISQGKYELSGRNTTPRTKLIHKTELYNNIFNMSSNPYETVLYMKCK